MSIWQRILSREKLLGWDVVGWVLALLVGSGLAMIMVFTGFNLVKGAIACFLLAAVLLAAKFVEVAIVSAGHSVLERWIFVLVLLGVMAAGTTRLVRWIYKNRPVTPPTAAAPPFSPPAATKSPEKRPPAPILAPKVSLIFKNSPLFTRQRKEHISKTVDEFFSYLTGLGFPVDKDFPPVGVSRDNVFRSGGVYPGSIYNKAVLLPRNRIDDADTIRWAFAREAFTDAFYKGEPATNLFFRTQAADVYALYYVSSFGGHPFALTNLWLRKLWTLRGKKGKDFTDRALFYTYKTWTDPPASSPATNDNDFDKFFYLKFVDGGANVVSNGAEEWDEVIKILNSVN